jgi:uncharacterized protein (UPF0335 family)
MTKLTDTLELWLQEQINTACRGLFDRLDRLEVQRSRDEDSIRDLYRYQDSHGKQVEDLGEMIDNLIRANDALSKRVTELEDRLVERTPDEQLSSFTDRVCEVFDTEPFKTTVEGIVADWVADSDVVCSTDDVVRILEETTFKIRVR